VANVFGTFLDGGNHFVSAHSFLLLRISWSAAALGCGFCFWFLTLAKSQKPNTGKPVFLADLLGANCFFGFWD
jgi:hypothetical protein